jgi:transposase
VLALDPRTIDALWTAIQGHLPLRPPDTHPLGCHRPRIPDRDCFTGMLVRLVNGCSWDVAARLTPAGETTLRGRRTEWLKAGVFDKLLTEALTAYARIIGLDLSEVAVDGSMRKAPCGGQGTGPNPTDRGKLGWKWSVATDTLGCRSAGSSTAPTATTPSCSNPPCKPSPAAACSPTSRRCTWTRATTPT